MTRSTPPRTTLWLLAACLLVAVPLLAAQSGSPPPADRQALAAELDAARRASLRAAEAFLDPALPLNERLAAADGFGAFLDEEHASAAIRLVGDAAAPTALRVAALERLSSDVLERDDVTEQLLALLTAPGTPGELREAAFDVAESLVFSSLTAHARRGDFLEAYRQLVDRANPELRRRALARLSAEADDFAQRRLLEGLRSPDRALVPAVEAVRLLGLRMPADAYPVLRELLADPPDPETRVEVIHHLGAHPPSRDDLVALLRDETESPAARQAALGALHANVPERLPAIVTPVLRDEQAPDDLRLRAIQAVQWRRLSSALRPTMEGLDDFDAAVRNLMDESGSEAVRSGAREYLSAVEESGPPQP